MSGGNVSCFGSFVQCVQKGEKRVVQIPMGGAASFFAKYIFGLHSHRLEGWNEAVETSCGSKEQSK